MKVTLKTIADESGFSITTVSRALAGYSDVNEETRQKIVRLAKDLGYVPNLTARQLRGQETRTIGLITPLTPYYTDPFFMELLSGVGRQAAEHGYDLLLSSTPSDSDEVSAYRRIVAGRQVDGVVVARTRHNDPRITYLKEAEHPFVVFGRSASENYPFIDVDGEKGMEMLVHHFALYGHKRIAMILSPRQLAFQQNNLTLRQEYIVEGNLSQRSGLESANELLALAEPPTAIIACNDTMALGAMTAIQRHGLHVGGDIAVAGFDDIPAAVDAEPPLTTIRQPIYEIGRQMVMMLIESIENPSKDYQHVLIQPKLIIRGSSGTPRITV